MENTRSIEIKNKYVDVASITNGTTDRQDKYLGIIDLDFGNVAL